MRQDSVPVENLQVRGDCCEENAEGGTFQGVEMHGGSEERSGEQAKRASFVENSSDMSAKLLQTAKSTKTKLN